jgi:hypothetical protein
MWQMRTRILGGLGVGLLTLTLAGCSSSSSSPTTTAKTAAAASTSTTSQFSAATGASSAQELANRFAAAANGGSLASFCAHCAVPSQVTTCAGDFSGGQVTVKNWRVGEVTVQGPHAVITNTGTACAGSRCISNSDPKAASNPNSAAYAGTTFVDAFVAANDLNSQTSTSFVAAAVLQIGEWYASGFSVPHPADRTPHHLHGSTRTGWHRPRWGSVGRRSQGLGGD